MSHVLHRVLKRDLPRTVRAEGVWIEDAETLTIRHVSLTPVPGRGGEVEPTVTLFEVARQATNYPHTLMA